MDIKECLNNIMNNYLDEKVKPFKGSNFNSMMTYEVPEIFYKELEIDRSRYIITASCGKGTWATIPWIAIFDKTITTSATRGYYIVLLFRADMKGVYVSLNQGYTWYTDNFKPRDARKNIEVVSEKIKNELSFPKTEIDLKSDNELAKGYELGNIFSKYYESDLNGVKQDIWKMLEYLYNLEMLMKDGWEAYNWENVENKTLRDCIVKALKNLKMKTGNDWHKLQEIYDEVETITGKPNANGGASIRATLQSYCSQTDTYKVGNEDLFEVKKIGLGEWRLKDFLVLVDTPDEYVIDIQPKKKAFLLPCNPTMYNIDGAVSDLKVAGWKQTIRDINVGDLVFIYVSYPERRICYKGYVKEANSNTRIDDSKYTLDDTNYKDSERHMIVEFKDDADLRKYDGLDIKSLRQHGIKSVQGSQKIGDETLSYINSIIGEKENNKLKNEDEFSKNDFLNDVYLDGKEYDVIVNLLLRKKNLILQGAPGVGKTYMAKKLAYSINGKEDSSKVKMIQFHQSYSYEDFIEGYRPDEKGFKLDPGVFYNFCKEAEKDPDGKYFFIIDEINRGNLSKIFGELLMLVENDKRDEKLTLTYSKKEFSVPENVYIIGMMNTADRSLAIMDYALRRRFSFYNVEPAFENENFKKYQYGLKSEYLNQTIEKIKKLNEEIEKDSSLGKGFKIGHSYFCNLKGNIEGTVRNILKYEILPMLDEYWFDNIERYENWRKILIGE